MDSLPCPTQLRDVDSNVLAMIMGRYEFLHALAGGRHSGVVWKALDRATGRPLAIRVFHPFAASYGKREAVAFARRLHPTVHLDHPGIAKTHAVLDPCAGLYVVVMDFIEGPTLSDLVHENRLPSFRETLIVLRELASALDHAHRLGIVCYHLLPGMIMLPERERPVIVDWAVTVRNGVSVSPHCIAPEVSTIEDGRTDVYALGVIAYLMATGQSPFSSTAFAELLTEKSRGKRISARAHVPFLPKIFDRFLQRCICSDPKDRFASMASAERALAEICDELEKPPPEGRRARRVIASIAPAGL